MINEFKHLFTRIWWHFEIYYYSYKIISTHLQSIELFCNYTSESAFNHSTLPTHLFIHSAIRYKPVPLSISLAFVNYICAHPKDYSHYTMLEALYLSINWPRGLVSLIPRRWGRRGLTEAIQRDALIPREFCAASWAWDSSGLTIFAFGPCRPYPLISPHNKLLPHPHVFFLLNAKILHYFYVKTHYC